MVTSLSHQLKTGFSVCRFYQLDIHWTCFCVVFLRPMLGDFFAPSTLKNSIFECWLEKIDYSRNGKLPFGEVKICGLCLQAGNDRVARFFRTSKVFFNAIRHESSKLIRKLRNFSAFQQRPGTFLWFFSEIFYSTPPHSEQQPDIEVEQSRLEQEVKYMFTSGYKFQINSLLALND